MPNFRSEDTVSGISSCDRAAVRLEGMDGVRTSAVALTIPIRSRSVAPPSQKACFPRLRITVLNFLQRAAQLSAWTRIRGHGHFAFQTHHERAPIYAGSIAQALNAWNLTKFANPRTSAFPLSSFGEITGNSSTAV
jgi:hypothetical protein